MTTRREILKYAGLGIGAAAASALRVTVNANAEAKEAQAPAKPAQTEITDRSGKRLAAGTEIAWTKAAKKAPPADITVDPAKPAQTILGFGAAFTDAACFTLSRLSDTDRANLLHTMFGQDRHALSTGRIPIGASDYSTAAYSYDDGPSDPELKRFSIDHDRDYILPTLQAALSANPDLFLFGSPWSPPGWMKYSNSMLGGNIRPENIPAYARYLQKFVEAYAAAGVNVRAVTTQNEIDADQGGRMPACPWPEEDEERLVAALGPLLEASGTKIWTLDHNYNLWGRALNQLSKPRFKKYVNTVAWHGYVGNPEMMGNVKERFPDTEMHWTEGGDEYKSADYLTNWSRWGATFSGILANGPQSITMWNLALDERGRPEHRPVQLRRAGADPFGDEGNHADGIVLGVGALCPGVSPRSCDCGFARRERRPAGGERRADWSTRITSGRDGGSQQLFDFTRVSHRRKKLRRLGDAGAGEPGRREGSDARVRRANRKSSADRRFHHHATLELNSALLFPANALPGN